VVHYRHCHQLSGRLRRPFSFEARVTLGSRSGVHGFRREGRWRRTVELVAAPLVSEAARTRDEFSRSLRLTGRRLHLRPLQLKRGKLIDPGAEIRRQDQGSPAPLARGQLARLDRRVDDGLAGGSCRSCLRDV